MPEAELIKWLVGTLTSVTFSSIAWVSYTIMRHKTVISNHQVRIRALESKKAMTEADVRHIVKEEVDRLRIVLTEIQTTAKEHTELLTELRISCGIMLKTIKQQEKKDVSE